MIELVSHFLNDFVVGMGPAILAATASGQMSAFIGLQSAMRS
jgi:hypothetical protein